MLFLVVIMCECRYFSRRSYTQPQRRDTKAQKSRRRRYSNRNGPRLSDSARRHRGRPTARLSGDILGKLWMKLAQDRLSWGSNEEAYTQQWVLTG